MGSLYPFKTTLNLWEVILNMMNDIVLLYAHLYILYILALLHDIKMSPGSE